MSMTRLSVLWLLYPLILMLTACKTVPEQEVGLKDSRITLANGTETNVRLIDGSMREEFDRGTENNFEFVVGADYSRSPLTFCYKDNEFSIHNAFWMSFLSSLSYQPSEFVIKVMHEFHEDAVARYRGPEGRVERYLQEYGDGVTAAQIARGMDRDVGFVQTGLRELARTRFVRQRDGQWYLDPSKVAVYPVLPKIRFMYGQQQETVESWFIGRQTFTTIDAQAMWIEFPQVAFLIFRGTQNAPDIATDADFRAIPMFSGSAQAKVHRGFKLSLDVLWEQIDEQIRDFESRHRSKPAPLYIGGHSLGGAMGALAAARLLMAKEGSRYRYNTHVYGLYSFGSPRVGNEAFNDLYFATAKERRAQGLPTYPIVRVRHGADIVTRVPYALQGFRHLGKMMFIPNDPSAHPRTFYSDYLHPDLRSLWLPASLTSEAYREYATRNFFQGRDIVRDHYTSGYFEHIKTSMLAAERLARRQQKSVCDPDLYAGREEDYKRPLLEYTYNGSREDLVVGVHKSRSDKLTFAVRVGRTERYIDLPGSKFIHESEEYNHRAVKFHVDELGDFVLFFDSRTAFSTKNPELPDDHPQQPRNGCGLHWYPDGLDRPSARVFFNHLEKSVPCEAVAAYGKNIWGGLFRDTWRRAGPR